MDHQSWNHFEADKQIWDRLHDLRHRLSQDTNRRNALR